MVGHVVGQESKGLHGQRHARGEHRVGLVPDLRGIDLRLHVQERHVREASGAQHHAGRATLHERVGQGLPARGAVPFGQVHESESHGLGA